MISARQFWQERQRNAWQRDSVRRNAEERKKELQKRTVFFIDFLVSEARRALLSFLNFNLTGASEIAQIESEREAEDRIAKDPHLKLFRQNLVAEAADVAAKFSALAIKDAKDRLGLVHNRLYVLLDKQRQLLDFRVWLVENLRPVLMDRVSFATAEVNLPRLEMPSEDQSEREARIKGIIEAKVLKRKVLRLEVSSLFAKGAAMILATIDGALTYLVIAACYEGTAGYFVALPYFLTLGVVIAMIWGAHEAIRKSALGWSALLLGTLSLSWLRVAIGGAETINADSASLAMVNILPIPIMAFLAALLLKKSRQLDETLNRMLDKIAKELKGIWSNERLNAEIQKANRLREQIQRHRDNIIRSQTAAHLHHLQSFLTGQIDRIDNQLMAIDENIGTLRSEVGNTCLEGLRPALGRFAQLFAEKSLDRDDKQGGDSNENGNGGSGPLAFGPWLPAG